MRRLHAAALAAALALLLGGCMSPVMTFGGGKSAVQVQQDRIASLMPTPLDVERTWTGEVRELRVRVWADDDYRAQNVRWQQAFTEELDDANEVLGAVLGIHLAPDFKAWDRHAPAATLDEDLAALAALDPGDGVFSVIGLTSSLPLVTGALEQLGVASTPGRHLMLRGYAVAYERKGIERAFRDLEPEELDRLIEAQRHHKNATLLLHEIGHNFGAPHEGDGDSAATIMSPVYSHHAASYSAHARELMLATLAARLGRSGPVVAPPVMIAPPSHDGDSAHAALEIRLSAAGAASIDGHALDDGALGAVLVAAFQRDAKTHVLITADRGAAHAAMAHVLDLAKAAGLRDVAFGVVAGD